eukprot:UN14536
MFYGFISFLRFVFEHDEVYDEVELITLSLSSGSTSIILFIFTDLLFIWSSFVYFRKFSELTLLCLEDKPFLLTCLTYLHQLCPITLYPSD